MKTLILILLDESGSMGIQHLQVVNGFNEFIQEQKKITEDEAWVTFVKFNTQVSVILKCEPVGKVSALQFNPNGGTALYDAIWQGVQLAEGMEGLFDRVICLILTDGEDNASRMITNAHIGSLIKKKEGEGKWTFLYIGQNPERWANQTGMSVNNVAAYNHSNQHMNMMQAQQGIQTIRQQPMQQMQNVFQPLNNIPNHNLGPGIPAIRPPQQQQIQQGIKQLNIHNVD